MAETGSEMRHPSEKAGAATGAKTGVTGESEKQALGGLWYSFLCFLKKRID